MAFLTGVAVTAFGKHAGRGPVDLMEEAGLAALADAGLPREAVDGLIAGYATTFPHLMMGTVMAERLAIRPRHAHEARAGGATGAVAIVLASHLIKAGACRNVLVLAGENRLTGQSRDDAMRTLAGVGHPDHEVPLGASIPAYYALLAARYLHETGASAADLAELAVLMRRHAAGHPGAQLRTPVSVEDVLASKPIARPLKFLDCCPISDGAAAVVVSAEPSGRAAIRIAGTGEAHTHQHISEMPDDLGLGAKIAAASAFAAAGRSPADMRLIGLYDSFTATLAIFIEALGFAAPGQAGRAAREGRFARDGALPLNLHGGLLSYGHSGVAGFLAHVVEVVRQMRGEAGGRQVKDAPLAYCHADGGVLSSHAGFVLERVA
ncbi:thiolase family protein [Phreatobacter sp.]|uniref:thiolase family protein n=1 Tax=Phreatobacter sp. TaxID=1966341 RepID=UPI003F730C72